MNNTFFEDVKLLVASPLLVCGIAHLMGLFILALVYDQCITIIYRRSVTGALSEQSKPFSNCRPS